MLVNASGWSTAASTSGEAKQAQSTQVENY
jgi:hypothetical protein